MKTMIIATLKDGWHTSFENLSEEAHEILNDVSKILFYPGIDSIESAKETLEAEGYYSYVPKRYSYDIPHHENIKTWSKFYKLLRELSQRAYPLTVGLEDIECFTALDVTDDLHDDVRSIDFEDLKVNDIPALAYFTKIIA